MKNRGEYKRYLRNKRSVFLPVTSIIVVAIFILSFVSIHVSKKIRLHFQSNPSITKLTYLWKNNDYQGVFDTSSILIEKKSLNNTILTYRGYSAYYLAISETDLNLSQEYIDEAIKCLRKALMTAKESTIAQIKYMLGRSYFYKNRICAYHYYADLVVKYLEEAKNLGVQQLEEELDNEIENKEKIVNKIITTNEKENGIEVNVTYEVLENIGTNEKIVF